MVSQRVSCLSVNGGLQLCLVCSDRPGASLRSTLPRPPRRLPSPGKSAESRCPYQHAFLTHLPSHTLNDSEHRRPLISLDSNKIKAWGGVSPRRNGQRFSACHDAVDCIDIWNNKARCAGNKLLQITGWSLDFNICVCLSWCTMASKSIWSKRYLLHTKMYECLCIN